MAKRWHISLPWPSQRQPHEFLEDTRPPLIERDPAPAQAEREGAEPADTCCSECKVALKPSSHKAGYGYLHPGGPDDWHEGNWKPIPAPPERVGEDEEAQ